MAIYNTNHCKVYHQTFAWLPCKFFPRAQFPFCLQNKYLDFSKFNIDKTVWLLTSVSGKFFWKQTPIKSHPQNNEYMYFCTLIQSCFQLADKYFRWTWENSRTGGRSRRAFRLLCILHIGKQRTKPGIPLFSFPWRTGKCVSSLTQYPICHWS